MRTLLFLLAPAFALGCSPAEAGLGSGDGNSSDDGLVIGDDGGDGADGTDGGDGSDGADGGDGSDGADGSDGGDGGGDGGDGGSDDHPLFGSYDVGLYLGVYFPEYDWGEDCDAEITVNINRDGELSARNDCDVELGRGSEVNMDATWYGDVTDDGGVEGRVKVVFTQDGYEWEEFFDMGGVISDRYTEVYYEEARTYGDGRESTELIFWGYLYGE